MKPVLTSLFAVLCGIIVPCAAAVKPPNILFFFADDWGRYAKCYAAVETRPSINLLAIIWK